MTSKYVDYQKYGDAQHQDYKMWSMLSDAPVLFYDKNRNDYYVYWHGIFTPRLVALAIGAHQFANIHITKSMIDSLNNSTVDSATLAEYQRNLNPKIVSTKGKRVVTAAELMQWFDIRRAS
jgi:hypothetical protein